jgi:pilus assembly protein CpaE
MDATAISILVIDGDSSSRNYLGNMLGKNGYTVLLASLGREGLISAWKDRPTIIIFDPRLPDMTGADLVSRLRQDRRTSSVPCVALSSQDNPQEATALLSIGCSEYLTKSNQALQTLLDLIPRLLSGEMIKKPQKRGSLIAFLSAKGGTGTSSMCANLAMCLGNRKIETRVAVMDLVLPIGSIAEIVGYNDRLNIITAAMQNPSETTAFYFQENLPRIANWNFNLLAGSPDPESANQLPPNRIDPILDALLESYDFVFVDLGRALSRISLPIIQRANVAVLIIGTDLSTATLTRSVWDYLKNHGVDPARLYALQNRAFGLEGLTKSEVEQITGLQIRLAMPYMGGNFNVANNRHEPIISKFPNDSAALTMNEIAGQIIELGQRTRPR